MKLMLRIFLIEVHEVNLSCQLVQGQGVQVDLDIAGKLLTLYL